MTYQSIVSEIARMPLREQLMLLETITRLVRVKAALSDKPKIISPMKLTRGMLKPNGVVPTDKELKDDYVNYLLKKYL
jgi:hypothetical protein